MAKPVKIAVVAETRKAAAAFKRLESELGLDKLTGGLKRFGQAAAAATAVVGTAAVAAGASFVQMASDFEQSAGAVDAIFKDQAAQIEAYSKRAQIAVGLSRTEYNELASVLGAQLKNGGTAMDKLGDQTDSLITLGADLSAMFGGTTADAVNALSSALKGERNPIERYGVTLRQAAIDARAAEMGFTKVGGSLTAEAQQAATLSLIMEQTADAHGKFAAEGTTWAGMVQRWQAQLKNFATDIGTRLMPIVKAFGGWVNKWLPGLLDLATEYFDQKITPAAKRLGESVWPAVQRLYESFAANLLPKLRQFGQFITGTAIPALISAGKWVWRNKDWLLALGAAIAAGVVAWRAYTKAVAIWGALKQVSTAIKGVNAAMRANPIGLIIAAIGALVAGLVVLYKRNEAFRNAVNRAWTKIKEITASFVNWFSTTAWPVIKRVWDGIKSAAASVSNWIATVAMPKLRAAWETVKPVFQAVADFAVNTLWPLIKQAWDGISTAIGAVVTYVRDTLIPWFVDAFNTVRDIPTNVWNWMKDTYNNIVNTLTDAVNWVKGVPGAILDGLASLGGQLWDWAKTAFGNIKSGAINAWNTLRDWLLGIPQAVIDALGDLGSLLIQAGRDLFYGFWEGMKQVWYDIKHWLTSTVTDQIPQLKGPPARDRRLLVGNGHLIMQGLGKGLRAGWADVADFLGSRAGVISALDYGSVTASLTPTRPAAPVGERHYHITVNALDAGPAVGRRIVAAIREYERAGGRA